MYAIRSYYDCNGDEGSCRQDLPVAAPGAQKLDDLVRHHRGLAGCVDQEDLGDQKIVPGPQELEDRERRQRREAERQDDLGEDLEIRITSYNVCYTKLLRGIAV